MSYSNWEKDLLDNYYVEIPKNEIVHPSMKNYAHFRVNDFKVEKKWQNEVKKLVVEYIRKKLYQEASFCLLGCSGSGKTHLSCAIGNYLLKEGFKVVRHDFSDLVQKYTNLFFTGQLSNKFFEFQLKKENADFIIIEDFLKDININSKRAAFAIIDYLYTNDVRVILNGEISIKKMMNEEVAVFGRIKQMCKKNIYEIPNNIENNYRLRE